MTLESLMKKYHGNASISIEEYCEELPDFLVLQEEPWWGEVKDSEVESFFVLGGGIYQVELSIKLQKK